MRQQIPVPFTHLERMSDDTGLFEHAHGTLPRRDHGYCLDDVGRGLVVLAREPDLTPALERLLGIYLAFVNHAQTGTGSFRNRLGFDRQWQDSGGTGDWWGRALWGLGTAAARAEHAWIREEALSCFERSAGIRSSSRRSMAYAAMGAAEVLSLHPGHAAARALLADAAVAIGPRRRNDEWPWPEHRLFYANAMLPEVLMAAGHLLDDRGMLDDGLSLLKWLLEKETLAGHLSVTPVGGRKADDPRPAFDQQPIEVSSLVDALARASGLDDDPARDDPMWNAGIEMGVAWFLGDNDLGKPMVNTDTGGGHDGLGTAGPSINQGAESTLAMISTMQHGRRLQAGDH